MLVCKNKKKGNEGQICFTLPQSTTIFTFVCYQQYPESLKYHTIVQAIHHKKQSIESKERGKGRPIYQD